jgi:uncharacterized protein YjbI with pentapeptide repeats
MGRVKAVLTSVWHVTRVWMPRLIRALLILSVLLVGFMALVAIIVLKRQGDLPAVGPAMRGVLGVGLFALVLAALWWVPRRQARATHGDAAPHDRAGLEDRFRRTFAAIVGGIVLFLLLGNALRIGAAVQANATSERLLRAADALGSERVMTRVAGVHALATLAETLEPARQPAYATLLAFVRAHASGSVAGDSAAAAPDVAAAVAVISRRKSDGDGPPLRPDFSGANLRGAALAGAWWDFATLRGTHLERADLRGARIAGKGGADLRGIRLDSADLREAHLDGALLTDGAVLAHADLRRADLDGATLRDADLRGAQLDSAGLAGASLQGARLDRASLKGADLRGATLSGAVLAGADFLGAVLTNAHLKGTDFTAALNLTTAQLADADLDETTLLPPGVARPSPRSKAR